MYIEMEVSHFCGHAQTKLASRGILVRWRRALIVDVKNFRTILICSDYGQVSLARYTS